MCNQRCGTFVIWRDGILQLPVVWILAAIIFMVSTHSTLAEEPPSALALLRGVESTRTQYKTIKAALEARYISPPPAPTIDCLVEMDVPKLRFEFTVLAGDIPGQVILRDGDEFHGYRRKEAEDVQVYDLQRAVGVRGDIAFDPRILGLSDLMTCDTTVKDCLWIEDHESLEVVDQESLHGVNTWKVKASRRGATAEFWIEEPSFRVHRKIVETPFMRIVIDSEFDSDKEQSSFPSRVTTQRVHKKDELKDRNEERIYIVKSFDTDADIPLERFTLKAMDLPFNTPVVDYRISRIVGYWDGEGLSEKPVYLGERPSELSEPKSQGNDRLLLIAINLLVLLVLIVVIWMRKTRGAVRPK